MTTALLLFGIGLVLLSLGAEGFVRGAVSLARRLGMSPLLIGLTVVAVATSLPELTVSLGAALSSSESVALGNVVGSNISNIALILGIAAILHPMQVKAQVIRVDAPILVAATLLLFGLLSDGGLSRLDGGILFVGILGYVALSIYLARDEPRSVQREFDEGVPALQPIWLDVLYLAAGLTGLILGARWLVDGAVTIAEWFGLSEIIIGLTIVAVGTSLPELATSVAAARRGEGDIAIGNAIGSSIFNIFAILGSTVLVHPFASHEVSLIDGAVMLGLAVLVVPMMRTGFVISRREGGVLIGSYAGYLVLLFVL